MIKQNSPPALSVINLSKSYHSSPLASPLTHSSAVANDFLLQNLNFTVQPGETLGIIGPNGAGKSTLLKLLASVTQPDEGQITHVGSLAPLIELGAGFNPELTGRENIYLNATILGLSRTAIDQKFATILDFSELAPYIDLPLKKYSSGMYLRLAFSIALQTQPHVLLLDEILAVGDEKFQRRCFRALDQLKAQGTAIIFVSHAINTVRVFCDRVLYLNQGQQVCLGDPESTCDRYLNDLQNRNLSSFDTATHGSSPDQQVPYQERLFSPTFLTKIQNNYYLIDCWHHRVIFNSNLIDKITHWQLLTDQVRLPHSLATDEDIIVLDSTQTGQLFVFSLDHQLLQILDLPAHNQPHRLRYDPERQLFYCLCANTQNFFVLKKNKRSRTLKIISTQHLSFLKNYYCRSFTLDKKNPHRLYFVAGSDLYSSDSQELTYQPQNARICLAKFQNPELPQSTLQLQKSFSLPPHLANMNDLYQIDSLFYLTATPKQIIRTADLSNLSSLTQNTSPNSADLYDQLSLQGTPYYLSEIDGRLYIPEINEHSRVTSCKIVDPNQQIADVKHQYDFGLPTTSSLQRKKDQSVLNSDS